jgi:hypothetical protein
MTEPKSPVEVVIAEAASAEVRDNACRFGRKPLQ